MFCIIQGRNFRKYSPGQAFPGTPVSTPFFGSSLLYSYITSVSTVVFAVALFIICFLFSVFLFRIPSVIFFYWIRFCHSTTLFLSNPRSFRNLLSTPFNRNFFHEPASVSKILVEWHVCRFRQFSSFNQFFSNEPASVRKILVEFGFLSQFERILAI